MRRQLISRMISTTAISLAVILLASCGADDAAPPRSTSATTGPINTGPRTTDPGTGPGSSGPRVTPLPNPGASREGSGPFPWTGDPKGDSSLSTVRIRDRQVVELDEPTVLVQRPGDRRLYAGERAGRVRMLTPDGDGLRVTGRTVLDISDDVTTEAERGLLGLAFSSRGDELYVSHTNANGDTRLEAYELQDDGTADATSKRVLLAQKQPFANHNGGNVVLGPDGDLYFGLGDGGAGDDPDNRAQDPDELLGKILRIDPTRTPGGRPYAIPAGNPYQSGGGRPEIYLSGVRNPWRFSFDRANGDLWIGDVGQNAVEEVDWLPFGAGAGRNLGWSGFEGSESYLDGEGRRPKRSVPPVFEYRHEDDACSITGGFVYRGKKIRQLGGAYVFADYCVGEVRALRISADGTVTDQRALGVEIEQPISFTEDAAGELYVLSQSGGISRLEPR